MVGESGSNSKIAIQSEDSEVAHRRPVFIIMAVGRALQESWPWVASVGEFGTARLFVLETDGQRARPRLASTCSRGISFPL